jgi:hypothetical protein
MKSKLAFFSFCILITTILLGGFAYWAGAFRVYMHYEQRIDEVDPNTGAVTYRLRFEHWYHLDLVRLQRYYDLKKTQIDSVVRVETAISERLNHHLSKQ